MIERLKHAVRRAVGTRIPDDRLNGMQAILSSADEKVAALRPLVAEQGQLIAELTQRFVEQERRLVELAQRAAEHDLHNAGMHAALTNLMLRNETLLGEVHRTLRDQFRIVERHYQNLLASTTRAGAKKARPTQQ